MKSLCIQDKPYTLCIILIDLFHNGVQPDRVAVDRTKSMTILESGGLPYILGSDLFLLFMRVCEEETNNLRVVESRSV